MCISSVPTLPKRSTYLPRKIHTNQNSLIARTHHAASDFLHTPSSSHIQTRLYPTRRLCCDDTASVSILPSWWDRSSCHAHSCLSTETCFSKACSAAEAGTLGLSEAHPVDRHLVRSNFRQERQLKLLSTLLSSVLSSMRQCKPSHRTSATLFFSLSVN